MGFRNGAYATVWEVKPISATCTQVKLTISKKARDGSGYETDFSGYVRFVGTNAASSAAKLHEKDRIKLGDTDVTTYWQAEKKVTYTNYACFSFESANANGQSRSNAAPTPAVDEGEIIGASDDDMPF